MKINQFSHKINPKDNTLYIYMVCLVPKESPVKLRDEFNQFLPAGWVRLEWERPDDPQVSFFRVYRVEVPYFSDNDDYSRFKWNMVADNVRYTVYSEKVDQNCAHFYYYKVTSVSIWGEESEGTVSQYRVPATVALQVPAMMVPFSKKSQYQINWLRFPHANKYIIYRKLLPRSIDYTEKALVES